MIRSHNFEKYIQDNYYNEIFSAIERYIHNNKNNMSFFSYMVLDCSFFELEDFSIKSISFHQNEGNTIVFIAAVEAEIQLKGFGKRDYEADSKQCWFSVKFCGHLLNGLNMVTIIDVDSYSRDKFNAQDSLDRFLIPYLYAKDLDAEAEKFLTKYYPKSLIEPMPINVNELLENMCLEMYYAPLDDSIFGMTYFSEADVIVFDSLTAEIIEKHISPGTILINKDHSFLRNVGSEKNTIIHECVHWDRHHNFFEIEKLINPEVSHIECHEIEGSNAKKEIDEALKWMEWQANALAPRILMPAEMTKRKFRELSRRIKVELPQERNAVISEIAVKELSEFFEVSVVSAKIRLIELGFDFVEGTHVYVNGKYYPPYSFFKDSKMKNQSYVLDRKSALILSISNQNINSLLNERQIVYANGLYCINDEKYISRNENGIAILTEYGLEHVDECCLVFDTKYKSSSKHGDNYYSRCYLCRDINSEVYAEAVYNPDYECNQNVEERAGEIVKTKEWFYETIQIKKETAGLSFSECLKYHRKRKGISQEELAFRSKLSDRAIRNYENKDVTPPILTVLALCIGLNLKADYCFDLINKAKYAFGNSFEDYVYQDLIRCHNEETIDSWNKILGEYGLNQRLP